MNGSEIKSVVASEAYSDIGTIGICVTVTTESGDSATCLKSPEPAMGFHEKACRYDGGTRFKGLGLSGASSTISEFGNSVLKGHDVTKQRECDSLIRDSSISDFGYIGTAALSQAIANTGAKAKGVALYEHLCKKEKYILPNPIHTCASGSVRYGGPSSAGGAPVYSFISYGFENYDEASYELWELMTDWSSLLSKKLSIKMNLDSPFAIPIGRIEDDTVLLDMMGELISHRNMEGRIGIYVNLSADHFFCKEEGLYKGLFREKPFDSDEFIELITFLTRKYPIVAIQDPLHCNDFEGYSTIKNRKSSD